MCIWSSSSSFLSVFLFSLPCPFFAQTRLHRRCHRPSSSPPLSLPHHPCPRRPPDLVWHNNTLLLSIPTLSTQRHSSLLDPVTVWIAGQGRVYSVTTTILALANHLSTDGSPLARLNIPQITRHLAAAHPLQAPPSYLHPHLYLLSLPRCSHQPTKSRSCSPRTNNLPLIRLYTIGTRVIASTSGSPILRENIASPPLMPSRACDPFPCTTLGDIARS
ncbi:hypothetical protein PISMIDRAFT_670431, partial [Pisolithus microcarpus 441]